LDLYPWLNGQTLLRTIGLQKRQFVISQWSHLTQLRRNDPSHATHGCASRLSRVPLPPHRVSQVESLHRVRKIAHEISPAELTIGGSLKSLLFLFGENPQDRFVFYLPQQLTDPRYASLPAIEQAEVNSRCDPPGVLCPYFSSAPDARRPPPRQKSITNNCR
jgi:hypothetical protein